MAREEEDILHQADVEGVIAEEYETLSTPFVSTTAALAAVGNAINTTDKHQGKMVWNSTTSKPVWANGPLAADLWKDSTGATAHTPV